MCVCLLILPIMFKGLVLVALAAVGAARQCKNITVPVHISARNGVFDLHLPTTEIDSTNFLLDLATPGNNNTANHLTGVCLFFGGLPN